MKQLKLRKIAAMIAISLAPISSSFAFHNAYLGFDVDYNVFSWASGAGKDIYPNNSYAGTMNVGANVYSRGMNMGLEAGIGYLSVANKTNLEYDQEYITIGNRVLPTVPSNFREYENSFSALSPYLGLKISYFLSSNFKIFSMLSTDVMISRLKIDEKVIEKPNTIITHRNNTIKNTSFVPGINIGMQYNIKQFGLKASVGYKHFSFNRKESFLDDSKSQYDLKEGIISEMNNGVVLTLGVVFNF